MFDLLVRSIPLKDVIADIAKIFDTEYFHYCDEYSLEIPQNFGEGRITGINFKNGLGILRYDCTFLQDTVFKFVVNKVHPLKFLFCAIGEFTHTFEHCTDVHEVQQYDNAIVASQNCNGHILRFKANCRTKINSLEIIREEFIQSIDCELKSLPDDLQNLFEDTEAKDNFYYKGQYSFKIGELFEDMEDFNKDPFLNRFFLNGKSLEILTQQIVQYIDDLDPDRRRSVLRRSEMKMIEKATKFIQENIEESLTIEQIAEHVGLNKKKLQQGFRILYRMSVNSYMQKIRLDVAVHLLKSTDLSISEIAYRVGINSMSYLSKVFKNKYNLTPKDFRKNLLSSS
ncbi:AraC family transcriptional regulator [Aquimarina sp. ERC-38]|uniref:helix-turn-helix domain-containing protein n=1 Tax=Aquimarina sp. ERC-38 TaxID=2949996 RepID=UPI002247FBCA|nr:AraC family transcriptional regulator [Aquimarina sp. ERC-38]UZO80097.1 AraC family transcriptional regulator [Aquimarina sp. ERC-38]